MLPFLFESPGKKNEQEWINNGDNEYFNSKHQYAVYLILKNIY